MTPATRVLVCAALSVPLVYAAMALTGVPESWLVFAGVIMFTAAYTVLDVLSHPARPIPGDWLRRRITVNVVYLATVGAFAIAVAYLIRN